MAERVCALAMNCGVECRAAWTDMRDHMRTEAPGADAATGKMWRRAGGEMGATHTHGATAEMDSAAAKMGSTAATTEVRAATAAANMAAATTAETAASGVSSSRQAKR